MKKIILKHKKDAAVRRFHPWIFSGAIFKKEEGIEEGDWVEVYSGREELLATGHYHQNSIAIRVLSFGKIEDQKQFWQAKIMSAYQYRIQLQLTDSDKTNCYRLIHAEGDGLPGLIVDIYGETAVVQCHSIGMHRDLQHIVDALKNCFGEQLKAIYNKSAETLPREYATTTENGYVFGNSEASVVKEQGHSFLVNWETGQKTGFFLDQRTNRQLLTQYVKGKKVLNAFCYSGGFSIYALQAGARQVDSVDISTRAIELTDRNVVLNGDRENQHRSYAEDVMQFLKTCEEYEVMVVDPPAFAKNIKKRHKAVQGYKRLNVLALKKLASNGILFTFSCSQVIGKQLFEDTITAAALEAGRSIRIMHYLSQGADHPVNLFHPESSYLKGLVLQVI
ncbi:MAG: class I SAM-dependent rRNA methyltransferase [Bacteroidota bacterium]